MQHLEIVLKTLQELLYIGKIIGKDGVKVHMENIRAILEWPSQKTITELRGFIGICTYYMKFVIGMSPFKELYGYDALKFSDMIFGDSRAPKAKDWVEESQEILKLLKDNL